MIDQTRQVGYLAKLTSRGNFHIPDDLTPPRTLFLCEAKRFNLILEVERSIWARDRSKSSAPPRKMALGFEIQNRKAAEEEQQ